MLQIKPTAPNPVTELGGYTPTTEYWSDIIMVTNILLEKSEAGLYPYKTIQNAANAAFNKTIFPGDHTAVEWAEFVMAINHMLWLLHSVDDQDGYIHRVLQALDALYYEWHDKALDTLKGEDLSTYLRITD